MQPDIIRCGFDPRKVDQDTRGELAAQVLQNIRGGGGISERTGGGAGLGAKMFANGREVVALEVQEAPGEVEGEMTKSAGRLPVQGGPLRQRSP